MAADTATAASPAATTAPDTVPAGQLWVEMRSPDGLLFAGLAQSITVPGTKGSMGILPRHAPLMSSLDVGLTRIKDAQGQQHRYVTGLGFVEVAANKVLLLVDFADRTDKIDVQRAQEAHDRAKARLRTREEDVDYARAEAALQRALMRLRFAGEPRI
jgi:F-type H+-transporting ATPase subunit epsilon